MSRHRAVRGYWQEEVDDGGYEWEVGTVSKMVPGADTDWILETLEYYGGDTEATIEYLRQEIGNGKKLKEDFIWENDVLIVPFDYEMLNVVFTKTDETDQKNQKDGMKQLGGLPLPSKAQTPQIADKKIDLLQLASKASESRVKFGDLLSKGKAKQQSSTHLLKEKTKQVDVIWSNNSKHKIAKPSAFAYLIATNSNGKIQVSDSQKQSASKSVEKAQQKKVKKVVKEELKTANEQINSDMLALGLESNILPKITQAISQKNRIKLDLKKEAEKRNQEKARLNIVVIGHVDSGKSTLMGHLLYKLGKVSDRTIKKFEKDAQLMRKGSFVFAWVLDETDQERSRYLKIMMARGVTVDVAINEFETDHLKFTLLDAPGHKDFIPNMINGATQADVALLVIDGSSGGFESGFHLGGQTREHAILVKSLGVVQLIVAINKMDMAGWSQSRFDHICGTLLPFLKQIGFKKDQVFFVPVSGFIGDNIIEPSENMVNWYLGKTLLHYLDNLMVPKRDISKPFRMPINDVFKSGMGGGILLDGRIESGTIQIGDAVCVQPLHEIGTVKEAIELGGADSAEWAMAGDHINLTLSGIDPEKLSPGNMLCDPTNLVPVSSLISVQALTLDLSIPITLGFPLILHHQQRAEPAIISKLIGIHDKNSGTLLKSNPRVVGSQCLCTLQIKLIDRPICVETYETIRELGRVTLRSGSETIAVGKVLSIDDAQNT